MDSGQKLTSADTDRNEREIWTAQDVATYLRCSARHVTNLAARGEIQGKRFGTLWRFRRQDIIASFTVD